MTKTYSYERMPLLLIMTEFGHTGASPLVPDNVLSQPEFSAFKKDLPITDERIREILASFTPILYKGIVEADNFFAVTSSKTIHDAVPMDQEEIEQWDKEYHIQNKIRRARESLFVPAVSPEELADLQRQYPIDPLTGKSPQTASALVPKEDLTYRVNLDPPVFVPLKPFDPDGREQFCIRPRAHLGGRGPSPSSLYNAFIDIAMYVTDSKGNIVVRQIEGTGQTSWSRPSFGPFLPMTTSLWFNTHVDTEKPNRLKMEAKSDEEVMLRTDIHHPESIDILEIPKDRDIRFFFWQLDGLMGTQAGRNPRRALPFK